MKQLTTIIFVALMGTLVWADDAQTAESKLSSGYSEYAAIDRSASGERVDAVNRVAKSLEWAEIEWLMKHPDAVPGEQIEFFCDLMIMSPHFKRLATEFREAKAPETRICYYSVLLRHPQGREISRSLGIDFSDLKGFTDLEAPVWATRAALLRAWLFPAEKSKSYINDVLERLKKGKATPYRSVLESRLKTVASANQGG